MDIQGILGYFGVELKCDVALHREGGDETGMLRHASTAATGDLLSISLLMFSPCKQFLARCSLRNITQSIFSPSDLLFMSLASKVSECSLSQRLEQEKGSVF